MSFEPIAIVARSCLFAQSENVEEFWRNLSQNQDMTSDVPAHRWRLHSKWAVTHPQNPEPNRSWSIRGGYITKDPDLVIPKYSQATAVDIAQMDQLQRWVFQTACAALDDVKGRWKAHRSGLILGNLSFPTSAMSAFAESVWFGELRPQQNFPNHRFMSGFPALNTAKLLHLDGPAFALDCACASGLVAIKMACDLLHSGRVDMMLAGAVNAADDLFIHVGFSALQALSKSSRSQPFSQDADGLLPSEGTGFVVLKRLKDALHEDDQILGVIRGVGMSNDGRGRGMLVPSSAGQVRAMQQAYHMAQMDPQSIQMVECHATGTVLGDGTELTSMSHIFQQNLHVASLKANMGHGITAAGIAGVIKTIESMRHQQLLAHRPVERLHPQLENSNFHLLQENQPWQNPVKRAGVSAFGFGGNNAHVILESFEGTVFAPSETSLHKYHSTMQEAIAIVGWNMQLGSAANLWEVAECIQHQQMEKLSGPAREIEVDGAWVKFPPNDLKQGLAQQNQLLSLLHPIVHGIESPKSQSLQNAELGIWIAMGTDVDVCRYGARWRMAEWADNWNLSTEQSQNLQDAIMPTLQAAGVLGCMPNIPANRLNSQLDAQGPSGTISAEENSGMAALDVAISALHRGEIQQALVGAVDCCANEVHQQAKNADANSQQGTDAAAVLLLKPLSKVLPSEEIYGVLQPKAREESSKYVKWENRDIGDCHSATAMVQLGLAILEARKSGQFYQIQVTDMTGRKQELWLEGRKGTLPKPIAMKMPLKLPGKLNPMPILGSHQELAPKLPPTSSISPPLEFGAQYHQPSLAETAQDHHEDPQLDQISNEMVMQWMEQWQSLQEQHQQFLQNQEMLHQEYLQWNSRMQELLFQQVAINCEPNTEISTPVVPASIPKVQTVPKPVQAKVSTPSTVVKIESHQTLANAPIPTGLQLSQEQLKIHSSGKISEIFGPLFEAQDPYAIQTGMPEPPLLLADRVTGLDAKAGSMQKGSIWTESDVREDSWFVHMGRMPAGIMIESGQADLMLISYLGIDLLTKGERAYRLLGCELMYHDDLPAVGDTLCYDIHVDGHAKHGDVRLFFFHYDCRVNGQPRLTVRQGQAGFFTEAELADSDGVLWKPEEQEIVADPVLDPPTYPLTATTYTLEQVKAFSNSRPWECFGEGLMRSKTHTRTPTIQNAQMLFLHADVEVDPKGGPWKRGYLRCEVDISPDDWFFKGHFKNDPCMPGTLMFEGCLQGMAFYLAAMGYTNLRDGWRFQPVPNRPYPLICRGQVLPSSKKLTYEIFVEQCSNGEKPYLIADLLCTVDGLKAFHARGMGLELVPDYPITSMLQKDMQPLQEESQFPIATDKDGFVFNYQAMMASALGQPSLAFGQMYQVFDGARRVARLPGPPYHFMSRVRSIEGALGTQQIGTKIILDYDVPNDAWYFHENGSQTMPFCVLLEAALQPCGWLASAVGSAIPEKEDLSFRNLDGKGTLHVEVLPQISEIQTFQTEVTITNISKSAGMIIESFDVKCWINDVIVYTLQTVFGFFPDAALQNQVGLPVSKVQRSDFEQPNDFFEDLTKYHSMESLRLANPMLRMIDRITGYDSQGGTHQKGWIRAEKDVDPAEWFFKAHFFQDPVQPGSLGIEAMIQVLQWWMLQNHLGLSFHQPRFTCLGLGKEMLWKYRGQVIPENKVISTTLDIVETGRDDIGVFARADASLWVDGKRIYEAQGLCVHIIETLSEI